MVISASVFKSELSRFAKLVQRADGQPFTGFDAGIAQDWEGYKPKLREEARQILTPSGWGPADVGSGRILSAIIQAIELKRNNLVRWPLRWGPGGQSHRRLLT